MKTYGGGGITPPFLEMSGQLHGPARLSLGKEPHLWLGGPKNRSGRCGEDSLASAGNRTLQPVAIPTELSRLLKEDLVPVYNINGIIGYPKRVSFVVFSGLIA
jgi:hypothetical protein